MAMDFPASPTEGQTFTPAGGPTYTYKAPAWRSGVVGIPDAPNDSNQYIRKNGVWTSVGPGSVAVYPVTASQISVAIPTGCRRMRLRGYLKPDTINNNIFVRFSKDNGASWLIGASDYYNSTLSQVSASVAGSTSANVFGYISLGSTSAVLATRLIDAEFLFPADTTEICQWKAHSPGFNASGLINYVLSGYCNVVGPYTHILVGAAAGGFLVTGRLIAEFDI